MPVGQKKRLFPQSDVSSSSSDQTGEVADAENFDDAIVFVDLTVLTAGSIDIGLEQSDDDGTTWFRADTVTNETSTGAYALKYTAPIGRYVRPVVDITTGPATFTWALELSRRG